MERNPEDEFFSSPQKKPGIAMVLSKNLKQFPPIALVFQDQASLLLEQIWTVAKSQALPISSGIVKQLKSI